MDFGFGIWSFVLGVLEFLSLRDLVCVFCFGIWSLNFGFWNFGVWNSISGFRVWHLEFEFWSFGV